jgi:hypothetical protein
VLIWVAKLCRKTSSPTAKSEVVLQAQMYFLRELVSHAIPLDVDPLVRGTTSALSRTGCY